MTLANRVDLASTFRLHSSPTATNNGYSDYGSLGGYLVSGSVTEANT